MQAVRIRIALGMIVSLTRHFYKKDSRGNKLLSRLIYSTACRLDPELKKLGRQPSIFRGTNGLPETNEVLETTQEVYLELCRIAQETGFGYAEHQSKGAGHEQA